MSQLRAATLSPEHADRTRVAPWDALRSCDIFDFGGLAIAFQSDSGPWLSQLGKRLGRFATEAEPELTFHYTVTECGLPPLTEFPPALRAGTRFETEVQRFRLDGPSFEASVDMGTRIVTASGPLATYPVDLVLRELLPVLAAPRLLLHSAVVTDGDRAWACAGPSGAGKSTLAALLGDRALCDELSSVEVSEEGVVVRSLPYWQARPGSARLAGIYLLHHSPEHVRTRVGTAAALRALTQQVVWPMLSPAAMRRSFDTFFALTERVPIWNLGFFPRADVWDSIASEN